MERADLRRAFDAQRTPSRYGVGEPERHLGTAPALIFTNPAHPCRPQADVCIWHEGKFAAAHKIALPLVIDPQGKLQAKVEADLNLGIAVGIEHTPTIFVVSDKQQGKPFVEVVDRRNLYSQIDEMIAEAGGTTKPATGKKRAATKPTI